MEWNRRITATVETSSSMANANELAFTSDDGGDDDSLDGGKCCETKAGITYRGYSKHLTQYNK